MDQVFENDFPALLPDPLAVGTNKISNDPLFQSEPVRGRCKVICFHPRHDLTMAAMRISEINHVLDGWKDVYAEEGKIMQEESSDGCVQIFEVRNQKVLDSQIRSLLIPRPEPRRNDGLFRTASSWSSVDHFIVS